MRVRMGFLAAGVGFVLGLPRGASAAYPGANGDLAYHVEPCDPGSAEHVGDQGCPSTMPGPVLYRVRSDGTELHRIFARNVPKGQRHTVVPWDGSEPVWSPDGRRIAFLRPTVPSRQGCEVTDVACEWWLTELVVGDAASGEVRTVLSTADPRFGHANGELGGVSWSPDGHRLVFDYSNGSVTPAVQDLYSVRDDGSDLRVVARLGWPRTGTSALDPAWSTRNWIALTRGSNIWMVRPDGRDLHAVTHAGGTSAAWTPSGLTLAYVCDRWLCTLRPGGARRLIVRYGTHPAWAPDARRIALVGRNGTYTARPDGSGLHMILRKRPSLCNFSITTRGCLPASLDWQPLPRR